MKYRPQKSQVTQYVYTIRVLLVIILVLLIVCGALTYKVVDLMGESEKSDSSSLTEENSEDLTDSSSPESSKVDNSTLPSQDSSKPNSSKTESSNTSSVYTLPSVNVLADQLDDWNLKLVNNKNYMSKSDNSSVALTKIKAEYNGYGYLKFDSRAIDKLHAMCAAAKREGISLSAISAYRTNDKQTQLFNNQVEKQRKKYPELSESELKAKASTISAIPGTSEHELGLAVDFNSVEESFETTKAFKWLNANADDYGFIMRYPKEKQSITGVIYEPWHYRYVGTDHAKKITSLGYCLEEYIEYLKNYK